MPNKKHALIAIGTTTLCLAGGLAFYYYTRRVKSRRISQKSEEKKVESDSIESEEIKSEGYKVKGNEKFKEGKLLEAILNYSHAIKLSPNKKEYYGNRSLAFIKNTNYKSALSDAEMIISLDASHSKGHHLKGLCLMEMEKFDDAKKSFAVALSIAPQNTSIKVRMNECDRRLRAAEVSMNPDVFMKELGEFFETYREKSMDLIEGPQKAMDEVESIEEATSVGIAEPSSETIEADLSDEKTISSEELIGEKEKLSDGVAHKKKIALLNDEGSALNEGDHIKKVKFDEDVGEAEAVLDKEEKNENFFDGEKEDDKSNLDDEEVNEDEKSNLDEEVVKEDGKSNLDDEEVNEDEKSNLDEEVVKEEEKSTLDEDEVNEDETSNLDEEEVKEEEKSTLDEDEVNGDETSNLDEEKVNEDEKSNLDEEEVKEEEKSNLSDEDEESVSTASSEDEKTLNSSERESGSTEVKDVDSEAAEIETVSVENKDVLAEFDNLADAQ